MTDEAAQETSDAPNTVTALEEIYPEPVMVTLGAETIALRPLTIEQFGAINRAVRVIAASLNDGEEMLTYVQEHAADLIPFVAAASGKDEAAVRVLYGGDFLNLFVAAMDANESFFGACAALRFGATGMKLIRMLNSGAGLAPSTISATAGTRNASATPPAASAAS